MNFQGENHAISCDFRQQNLRKKKKDIEQYYYSLSESIKRLVSLGKNGIISGSAIAAVMLALTKPFLMDTSLMLAQ